jgi:hypothetical protein
VEELGSVASTIVSGRLVPADYRPVHTLTSATGVHAIYQQQVRGHDVVGGRVLVHGDGQGAYGISGHPTATWGAAAATRVRRRSWTSVG